MATEKQEVKLKKALMDFINKEIVIQADPNLPPEFGVVAVSDRKYQLVELLFLLFKEFNNYTNPPELDKTVIPK